MSDVDQKIQALDYLSRRVLLQEAIDKGVADEFCARVAQWNEEERRAFLSGFGVNEVQLLISQEAWRLP